MPANLIKKEFFPFFLFFYLLFITVVYPDSGLSGSFSLSYIENKSAVASSATKKDSFVQKYGIGYRGSIYSPKLLSYDLRASLYLEDTAIETNNIKSDSNSRGENYDINLNFIKDTFMPFSVSKTKNYSPYWSVINGESSFADQDTESTNITGSLRLRYFDLVYNVQDSVSTKKDDISKADIDKNYYSLSLYKAFEDKRLNIMHSFNKSDYKVDSIRYTVPYIQKERSESSRLNFDWNIKENLKLNTYSTYRNDRTFGVESTTGSLGLHWNPSKKVAASFNLGLNSIDSAESKSDSIMFTENSSYIMTEELTLRQDLLFFNSETDKGSYDAYSAGVGSAYRKKLNETLSFNAGIDFNKKIQQNDFVDSNISTKKIDYDRFGINAGLNKNIKEIRSKASATAYYNNQLSSFGDDNLRTSLNINLFTFLENDIKNNFTISYAKESGFLVSAATDKLLKRNIEARTISDSLNYSTRIGFKGRLSTGVGVSQRESISTTNNGENIKALNTYPYANVGFNYNIWRTMVFNSTANISQDSTYDMTNYSGYAAINYNYRKLQMTVAVNYLKRDDPTDATDSEQTSINMLISRNF